MAFKCGIEGLRELIAKIENEPSSFLDMSRDLKGDVVGMSGLKFRLLISEVAARMMDGLVYLEIGIYQGLSPLTVARRAPQVRVVGVDNFSQVDEDGTNLSRIEAAIDLNGVKNFEVFNCDFEQFLIDDPADIMGRVGLYYFDASHDYRSQILALMHASNWVAERGMIAVDDCNYPHVRQATFDFLSTHPEYKLLCEYYTIAHPHYYSMGHKPRRNLLGELSNDGLAETSEDAREAEEEARRSGDQHLRKCRETWWNGVHIMVHDPEDLLEPILPHVPTEIRKGFLKQHGFAGCDAEGADNRLASLRQEST